nr:MAG TPA: hypothetical protein [Siphoviridae sp. ctqcj14]
MTEGFPIFNSSATADGDLFIELHKQRYFS